METFNGYSPTGIYPFFSFLSSTLMRAPLQNRLLFSLFLICAISLSLVQAEPIAISVDQQATPRVLYGAMRLKDALTASGQEANVEPGSGATAREPSRTTRIVVG